MNEAGYIRSVHRHLPADVYAWKIADRFTAGVPDTWYSGCGGHMFIEWKYLPKCPKKFTPKLSTLQKVWLSARATEGRTIAVIIGSPQGGVILHNKNQWSAQVIVDKLLKPKDIALWITSMVTVCSPNKSPAY